MAPAITAIEFHSFTYELENVGRNPLGIEFMYQPGESTETTTHAIRIETDSDVTGEYIGGTPPGITQAKMVASILIGRNPLDREAIWYDLKRLLRKYDGTGIGPLDIALWDYAGKYSEAPIHALLGTYRTSLPAYISTYIGGEDGGFDSPDAFADFAETAVKRGFPAFKLHTWRGRDQVDIEREIETVRAVGERVGAEMDLMHDPVCEYETFADALEVGRELDNQGYFWYEDPYSDGSRSHHAHRKLSTMLDTPLLLTEQTRGIESHTDFIAAEATDFVRADPDLDGGITGAMKIARIAEGFGLDVEYHLASPATRHCMAATRNTNYYELGLVAPECPVPHSEPPVYEAYTDSMDAATDGSYPVPHAPGLGVTLDWEYIEAHATNITRID